MYHYIDKFLRNKYIINLINVLFLFIHLTYSEEIVKFSFKGPYENITATGFRYINDNWLVSGSAEVMKNFIRLTPDRQSHKGYIWSKNQLQLNNLTIHEFSAILTFRVSGQGSNWFGDGIALWFTNQYDLAMGDNHGFIDKYVGIGIIIDTFVNPEHKGGHKDISLQFNNGKKSLDELNELEKIGCDNKNIRYHEGNAAFDPVHSASRIKIKFINGNITISIDPKNHGDWEDCYNGEIPNDLKATSFLKEPIGIGITASTGALADNHDILRFALFDKINDQSIHNHDTDAMIHSFSKEYDKWIDDEGCNTECKIAILSKKLKNFHIEYEHKMADLKEKTQNTITKLKKQEADNEQKIILLEETVERMIHRNVQNKITDVEKEMNEKMENKMENKIESHVRQHTGWKLPFFILIVGLVVGGIFLYKKYQQLRKTHLL